MTGLTRSTPLTAGEAGYRLNTEIIEVPLSGIPPSRSSRGHKPWKNGRSPSTGSGP